MAGRRTSVPGFTEISAVCTHPDARRRGYGEVVTSAVAQRLLDEGVTPFLHVALSNDNARRVYERMGFTHRRIAHFVAVRARRHSSPAGGRYQLRGRWSTPRIVRRSRHVGSPASSRSGKRRISELIATVASSLASDAPRQ